MTSFPRKSGDEIDRVLEIGGYAAGYCGRLFARNGHDVVRIENDVHRPAWVSQQALDLYLHPNKRRVRTEDVGLIGELANNADVVIVEVATASEVDELQFDSWDTPVKVAVTPFGRTGPDRDSPATPSTILAMGGYSNLMGDSDRAPLTLPGHYVEFQAGGFAFAAANACRIARASDSIDIGMLEVLMALSQFTTVMWTCANEIRSRHGNDFWSVVPTNLFRCRDGWVYFNIVPGFWDAFTVLLEKPELTLDERFKSNERRKANRDDIHEITQEVMSGLTREEIQRRATECRLPMGAVLSLSEVLRNEHLAQRAMWETVQDEQGCTVQGPRVGWRIHGASSMDLKLSAVQT